MLEALKRISGNAEAEGEHYPEWETVKRRSDRSVTAVEATLQDFDPCVPPKLNRKVKVVGCVGRPPAGNEAAVEAEEPGFDVVWCQWCLGHMSNLDLVTFFKKAQKSLRSAKKGTGDMEGLIVVKENVCWEHEVGVPREEFDDNDSSLTRSVFSSFLCMRGRAFTLYFNIRSDLAWKKFFADAGLTLIKEQVQQGFPKELYPVKMWVGHQSLIKSLLTPPRYALR